MTCLDAFTWPEIASFGLSVGALLFALFVFGYTLGIGDRRR